MALTIELCRNVESQTPDLFGKMCIRDRPTLTSEFILLYTDTSLLAAVGVVEIVMNARTIVATTGSITPYVVCLLYTSRCV